jgi:pimeloyl-ACP methyl ester carboxylesterase
MSLSGDPHRAHDHRCCAVMVISGESDRIVDPEYGRAFAAAIPGAKFVKLAGTGHLPQLETPEPLIETIWNFGQPNR